MSCGFAARRAARGARHAIAVAGWLLAAGACVTARGAQSAEPTPARIRSLEIVGAQEMSAGQLRSALRLRPWAWWRPFQKNFFYGVDHLEPDLVRLVAAFRDEGFYFARIDSVVVRQSEREWVAIEIDVTEGPRVRVDGWSVRGAPGRLAERAAAVVGIRRGDPLRERHLRRDEARLDELCADAGYALAEVTHELRFRGDSADVVFHVAPGPRVRVGGVAVSGLERTRTVVVRREIGFRRGDIFRRSRVLTSQARLFDLGLFRAVRILPAFCDTCVRPLGSGEIEVDLHVVAREKAPGWFGGGLGFSSQEELRLLGEWGYRNLRGKAHAVQLTGFVAWSFQQWERRRVSEPSDWQIETIFTEPWLLGTPLRGQLRGSYRFNREPTFREEIVGAEFRARRDLDRFRSLFGSVQKKWVSTTEPTTGGEDFEIPSLSLWAQEDRRDFVLDPQRGYLAQLRGDFAGDFLGGPVSFARWAGGVSSYVSLRHGVRWANRARAGYLHPWGPRAELPRDSLMLAVPYDERFRAGGGTTVRGHATERLGPFSPQGQALGGLVLVLLNTELRFPLIWQFEGALFVDAGNIWADYRQLGWSRWTGGLTRATYDDLDMVYAAGGGVRFVTPVGPVRLDLGWKLNRARRAGTPGAEWHFSLGQAF